MSPIPTAGAAKTARPDGTSSRHAWQHDTALFVVHWGRSGAVIAATGEIDAANAKPLAEYLQRCAERCEWLVLDLSELEFIGTAGLSVLEALNEQCARAGICWTVVPGLAVSTLLRVCDQQARIPVTKSRTTALAKVPNRRALLREISTPQ